MVGGLHRVGRCAAGRQPSHINMVNLISKYPRSMVFFERQGMQAQIQSHGLKNLSAFFAPCIKIARKYDWALMIRQNLVNLVDLCLVPGDSKGKINGMEIDNHQRLIGPG